MLKFTRRRARLTAVIGLAALASLAFATPAQAAHGQPNTAEGILATGAIVAGPFAECNYPAGPFTDSAAGANIPGVLTAGAITCEATDRSARASVADLAVDLGALADLNANAVTATCAYDPASQQLSGDSQIAGGQVVLVGGAPITLDASPAPNTTVAVPGVPVTIILNRQVVNPDGSLTVTAIYVQLGTGTGPDQQTLEISKVTCQPEVVPIPVIAPQFAAGAGVLGLLVLGFVLYRRRQTRAAITQA